MNNKPTPEQIQKLPKMKIPEIKFRDADPTETLLMLSIIVCLVSAALVLLAGMILGFV